MDQPIATSGLPANIYNFFKLYDRISQELNHQIETKTSLTLSQYQFLHAVEAQPDITLSDIADVLGCTRGNVSGLAERLLRQNLIERNIDPDDRRRAVIRLTPAGKQRLTEAGKIISQYAATCNLIESLPNIEQVQEVKPPAPEPGAVNRNSEPDDAAHVRERSPEVVVVGARPSGSVTVKPPVVCINKRPGQRDPVVVIRRTANGSNS